VATSEDQLSRQVELMQQMNATLEKQLEMMSTMQQRMGSQSDAYGDLNDSIEEVATSSDNAAENMFGLGESTDAAAASAGGFTESIKGMASKMSEAYDKVMGPFSNGLDLLNANFTTLVDVITNPVGAAFGFLRTLYDSVIEKAAEYYKQQFELLDALEKVRDKFGSFEESTSARVKRSYEKLSGSLREAAGGAGVFGSKFSPGIRGSIEQLEKMSEIMTDLGPIADAMGSEFERSTAELYVLKEGLAFGDQALQQTGRLAMLAGKSVKQFGQEIMSSVDKIGRNFGVSTKVLGADVGKALSNFKMLGKMTGDYVKQITQAAVFTRKLGFEITELTGLVDKFDDFEQGAEAAAQLAQGFGLVLDPLKMMNMEDPAARLQEVQRAFMATGRSVEAMTRQERALLASTSGLSEEILTQALSAKGLSMSYDDIASGANDASKKQKSMEQTFRDLSRNIENVLVPFEKISGFVTAFIEGFLRGFGTDSDMMAIIKELAEGIGAVAKIGGEAGRIFADILFPEGKESSFLSVAKSISKMFIGIAESIRDFLKLVKEGDTVGAAEKLITGIFSSISTGFEEGTSQFNLGSMVTRFGLFIIEFLTGVIKALPKILKDWTLGLRNMFKKEGQESTGPTILDSFKTALSELVKSFDELLPVLMEFGTELMMAIPKIISELPIASLLVSGGPIFVMLSDIVGGVFEMFGKIFADPTAGSGETGEAASKASMSVGEGLSRAVTTVVEGTGTFFSKMGDVLADATRIAAIAGGAALAIRMIGDAVHDVMQSFVEPDPQTGRSFMDFFADASARLDKLKPETVDAVGIMLGAIMLAVVGMVGAVAFAADKMSTGGLQEFLKNFATGGIVAGGVAAGLVGLITYIAGAMRDTMTSLIQSFGSAEFIEAANKLNGVKFDGAADVVKLMATMMKAVYDISAVIGTGFSGSITPATAVEIAHQMRDIFMGGPAAKSNVGEGLLFYLGGLAPKEGGEKSSLDAVTGLSLVFPGVAKTITSIFEVITSLSKVPNISTAMANMNVMIGSEGFLVKLGVVIDQLAGLKPVDSAVKTSAENLSTAIAVTGTTITSLTNLPVIAPAAARLAELTGVGGATGFMSMLGTLSLWVIDSFGPSRNITGEMVTSVRNLRTTLRDVGDMTNSLDDVLRFTSGVDDVTTKITAEKLSQFEDRLVMIVESVRMVNDVLRNLDKVDINATIDKLESNMKLANTSLKIAGGAVNVNVQLNVTMNAEKMAAQLVASGYVLPTGDFDEFMQNTDGIGEQFTSPETKYNDRKDTVGWGRRNDLSKRIPV
jgi:hypothetical protein